LRGHKISLDYRIHLSCSGAKSDDHALDHAARTATLELDEDDGMHEVEDEEPEVDFAEDTGELGVEDSGDDDDER